MISVKNCIFLVMVFSVISYLAGYYIESRYSEIYNVLRNIKQTESVCVDIMNTPTEGYRVCGYDENLNGVLDVEEATAITKLK